MPNAAIHVCITCIRHGDDSHSPRSGARLHEALKAAIGPDLALRPVECLGNCQRGCTVAFSAQNHWTYVFGDLSPDHAGDVAIAARLLAASENGLMPWKPRPEPFKRGMIARIPPYPFLKEDAAE